MGRDEQGPCRPKGVACLSPRATHREDLVSPFGKGPELLTARPRCAAPSPPGLSFILLTKSSIRRVCGTPTVCQAQALGVRAVSWPASPVGSRPEPPRSNSSTGRGYRVGVGPLGLPGGGPSHRGEAGRGAGSESRVEMGVQRWGSQAQRRRPGGLLGSSDLTPRAAGAVEGTSAE